MVLGPAELDAIEAAASRVTGVACIVIEPDYVQPPGPSPSESAFLDTAPIVLRLVRAYRDTLRPTRRLLDVWLENERLRNRVTELETANCKDAE